MLTTMASPRTFSTLGFFFLVATTAPLSHAFSIRPHVPTTATTTLHAAAPPLPGVGGGVPVHPAGGRHLFDPAQEGKLGGTDNLDQRLALGCNFYLAPTAATPPAVTDDAQHWLLEEGESVVPPPFCKASKPVTATVLGRGRLIAEDAPGDIQHIVLRLPEGMHYVEGQSLSVIPPGVAANGKPHKPRLYSIAR